MPCTFGTYNLRRDEITSSPVSTCILFSMFAFSSWIFLKNLDLCSTFKLFCSWLLWQSIIGYWVGSILNPGCRCSVDRYWNGWELSSCGIFGALLVKDSLSICKHRRLLCHRFCSFSSPRISKVHLVSHSLFRLLTVFLPCPQVFGSLSEFLFVWTPRLQPFSHWIWGVEAQVSAQTALSCSQAQLSKAALMR